jgi:hypothetical protein
MPATNNSLPTWVPESVQKLIRGTGRMLEINRVVKQNP